MELIMEVSRVIVENSTSCSSDLKPYWKRPENQLPLEQLRQLDNRLTQSYQFDKKLGAGGQGEATLWRRKGNSSGGCIVVKLAEGPGGRCETYFLCRTLRKYRHNRIIQMYDYLRPCPIPDYTVLILEVCDMDLSALREESIARNQPLPESFLWRVTIEITEAVAFLHTGYGTGENSWTPILHRDIKPSNVFLKRDAEGEWHVKLADFGLAKWYDEGNIDSICGTEAYLPPEHVDGKCGTPAADIWGIGATLHTLCLSIPPFDKVVRDNFGQVTDHGRHPHLINKRRKKPRRWMLQYSDNLNGAMMLCLREKPRDRVDAVTLLQSLRFAPLEGHSCARLNPSDFLPSQDETRSGPYGNSQNDQSTVEVSVASRTVKRKQLSLQLFVRGTDPVDEDEEWPLLVQQMIEGTSLMDAD